MTPLLGFSPDLPKTTTGIITACDKFIPYESGMEAAPSAVTTGADALAAAAVGGIVWTKLDGSNRIIAGSATRLYSLGGTTWTDQSAGGLAYNTATFWTFAPFGDYLIAAGGTANTLQVSTTSTFAAISGAPKAKIVFSVVTSGGGFVIAANTDTAVDQWACSGVNDHTTWAVSTATQANTGRLLGNDSGALTAGIEFGDRPILFKRRAMFVGEYVGSPGTFQFREIGGGVGCVGPYSVVNADVGLVFVGPSQIWFWDGATVQAIGEPIRQWFFDDLSQQYAEKIRVVYDEANSRVRIHYPRQDSTGLCNGCVVYHLKTRQWGLDHMTIEHAMVYTAPGVTWDTLTGTWASQTGSWEDYQSPSERNLAIFDSSHVLKTLTGVPGTSYFTTEEVGDEFTESLMDSARLRYATVPSSATAEGLVLDTASGDFVQVTAATPAFEIDTFHLLQEGRFHRVTFTFTGNVRVVGKQFNLKPSGSR